MYGVCQECGTSHAIRRDGTIRRHLAEGTFCLGSLLLASANDDHDHRGWHGTTAGYTNHKCRCEACRAAWRNYRRSYRARFPERNPVTGRL